MSARSATSPANGDPREPRQPPQRLAVFLGALLGAPLLVTALGLSLLGSLASFSPCGWLEIAAAGLLGSALLSRGRTRRATALGAAALLAGTAAFRLVAGGFGRTQLVALSLRDPSPRARWLGRWLDEQDVSLLGARALRFLWHMKPAESDALIASMRTAYVDERREQAVSGSAVLDTFLQRQSPRAFDTVIIEARGTPRSAVIFLHGYAGNFTLECWLVAQAAREVDAITYCPSTDFSGRWAEKRGQETLRATIDAVHARGIRKIVLAGLSNGGVGAGALAPKFADELDGLLLISGVPGSGDGAGLPTLVVQGARDPMAPAQAARAFASRAHGSYAEFEGGHFVLLLHRDEVRETMARWLRNL